MFGQSSQTNTFGQPTAFGNTNATPFGSMNPQPQQSSLFGQTSTPSLFGMNQPNSIFGASNPSQANTFGTQQPQSTFGNTSLFGNTSQPQTNTLFNNTNRFGMSTGSTFAGGLGQTMNIPAGTTVKFVPQTGTDTMMKNGHSQSTSINIRLQCITCMREYESKSLEELRHEDYNANRKGPQQQQSQPVQGNLFGSSTINNSSGLFGNANSTNTFGASASTGNLFNQNKPTFGSIAPTTTTTSFFGSNLNQNKSTFFGSTPQNTATTFPTQAQPSLFGNSSTTQPLGNTSFFGSSNLNTNTAIDPMKPAMFGQPTSQSTSIFGSSTPQNLATNKPSFGSTTTPFGAQTQPGTNLFGSTNTNSGNVFGATSQPSLFNANTATNTGLGKSFNFSSAPSFNTGTGLGTTTSSSNLFGASNNTFGTTGGSNLFGSNLNSNFNFNASTQPFQNSTSSFPFNSNTFGNTNSNLNVNNFANQSQAGLANPSSPVNTDQIIARLQTLPYGSPQLLVDSSLSSNTVKTKFTTDPKTLNQYKINAKSQAEVKVQRVPSTGKPTTLLFDGLDDESTDNLKCAQDIFSPRPNIKKLVLNKNNTSLFKSSFIQSPAANETEVTFSNKENRSPESNTFMSKQVLDTTIDVINKLSNDAKEMNSPLNTAEKSLVCDNLNSTCEENVSNSTFIPKCGIVLTRTDFYTIPSIEECDAFYSAENDSCVVDSFTVGRVDYGSIFWKGPLNVKGINLDEIVHIRRKEVIVYPDDDAKPPVGDGLNRPAQITLDQVWPIDKTTREFIKDPQRLRAMKYSEKVESATIKLDAIFKEYRPDTGSWVFTVKHFSKYGLDADDEDTEMDTNKANPTELKNANLEKKDSLKMNGDSFTQFSIKSSPDLLVKDQAYQINSEMNGNFTNGFHSDNGKDASLNNVSNYYNYDSLFNEEDEMAEEKSNQLKSRNELNLMRSALFVDQDEAVDTVTKKCKNLSFTKSATSHQVIPSLFPSKIQSSVAKRRRLNFEPAASKLKANIYSVNYAPCPRVNFSNGSNRFCWIHDGQVIIFDVNLLNLEKNNATEKLEEHLKNNSSFISSNQALYPPLIKSNKFGLNVGMETNLNSLIEALYGELSETLSYSKYQERLRLIESWLFRYNKTLQVPEKPIARIIHFLTTNELEFAVTECINSKQPRLSYLIAAGPFNANATILAQLDQWKRSEADIHMDRELLKLYVLFSGQSKWMLSNNEVINVFEDLQWTQQLILILLYKNRQMNDSEIGTNLVKSAITELETEPNVVEYHLLAQNQPWVAIASCPNLLDSWFLHESLSSYNVIVDDIFTNKSDFINIFLASQAKDLRCALFFVLHIRNEFLRFNFTKELLVRHARQLVNPDVESFLKEKLSINPLLISEAKLFYSKSRFNCKATAFNLIDCGEFNQAHEIFTEKVFPELIINEDYNEIMQLIGKLQNNQHLISNWNINGAGVYEIFNELLQFSSKSDLVKYKNLIENFNAHQLRCPTKRHRLCQSQMSRVANIIHAQLNDGMFAYNTPVPDDYALLELRSNAYKILETNFAN